MSDKKNTIELPRTVVELHRFLSKDDDAPPQKRTVYIERAKREGWLSAFATTGVHMCVVHWEADPDIGLPLHVPGWMLEVASARSAALDFEGDFLRDSLTLTREHGQLVIDTEYPGGPSAPDTMVPSVDWYSVYSRPVREKGAAPVGAIRVNMSLVAVLADYLKACGIANANQLLQIPGDELDSLRIDLEGVGEEIRYIVMPCKP